MGLRQPWDETVLFPGLKPVLFPGGPGRFVSGGSPRIVFVPRGCHRALQTLGLLTESYCVLLMTFC
ncbi:hypothetical protein SAMN04488121_105348 [Chitinophaga filiformis]|uniref:Uncharacterized protein n=1 Tax=Chitinophaga filiformis TaxID=104663 RepID=A0A1G7VYB7_CHIFI|nr:hypothetical protein SAMN04488121_105348 [Chitinophaga filiformis]